MAEIEQTIRAIQIEHDIGRKAGRGFCVWPVPGAEQYPLLPATKIEAIVKPGMYCDIPYFRVWLGDECVGDFCQHNIVGVY